MRKESYMGKIISIDDINRAAMEGKDDLVFELCNVCDGTEPLTAKVKRLIFSDREVAC